MPEELSSDWEYFVPDSEIQELLDEEAQYLSCIDQLPTVDDGNKKFRLDGFRLGDPNHSFNRLSSERITERDFKRLTRNEVQLFDRECANSLCAYVFKPRTETNVYCSLDCFHKERYKDRTVYEKTCARNDCARTFKTVREQQIYCSSDCVRFSFLRKRFKFDETCIRTDGQMKGAPITHHRICQNVKCNKPYYATRFKQKYCGMRCRPIPEPGTGCIRKRLEKRNCANIDCQKEFQPKRGPVRYCGAKCRGIQMARERGNLLAVVNCVKCKEPFKKKYHYQEYCSLKCFNQRNK